MVEIKLMRLRELPKCQKCDILKICGGACIARAFQAANSLKSPDWTSCIIAQKVASESVK